MARAMRSPTTPPRPGARAIAASSSTPSPPNSARGAFMGFLLIKILFLLGLAAVSGGFIAYWWFRRHYEDVTLEYTHSRADWDSWRRGFEERLGARPAVD